MDRKLRATIVQLVAILTLSVLSFTQTAPSVSSSSGKSLRGGVAGQNVIATGPTSSISEPSTIFTSGFVPLNPSHDLCQLIQDAEAQEPGNFIDVTSNIADTAGSENCTVPFIGSQSYFGTLHFRGTRTIITTSITQSLPGNITIDGEGTTPVAGTTATKNTIVRACNPAWRLCPGGAFFVPSQTVSSTSVSGTTFTVNMSAALPAYPSTVKLNPIAVGHLIQLLNNNGPNGGTGVTIGDTLANGNSLLYVTACTVPSSTCGQTTTSFTALILTGSVNACASSCGTAYLVTPLVALGTNTGSAQFDIVLQHLTLDCQFMPGCMPLLVFNGQEGTTTRDVSLINSVVPSLRITGGVCTSFNAVGLCTNSGTVSNPYGGFATGGVNSGADGYDFSVGWQRVDCALVAGCGSNGAGGAGWTNGATTGLPSTAGNQPYLNPDPAVPNLVMVLIDGTGLGQSLHGKMTFTISGNDGGGFIPEVGTTGTCLLAYGMSFEAPSNHIEYCPLTALLGGDPTVNGAFGGGPTSGINITNGLYSPTVSGGGYVFTLGSTAVNPLSGFINPVHHIRIDDVNVGNQSFSAGKALIDNTTLNAAGTPRTLDCYNAAAIDNDQTISYHLGAPPAVDTSSKCVDAAPGLVRNIISTSQISDYTNQLAVAKFVGVASAVDQVTITNSATGSPATVSIASTGTDPNINLNLICKGACAVQLNGAAFGPLATGTGSAHQIAGPQVCSAASASPTAYTCTTSPSFTPADQDIVLFEADVASAATPTIQVNGSTVGPTKKGGGATALVANDFLAGGHYLIQWDGTNWQVLGQTGGPTNTSQGGTGLATCVSGVPLTGGGAAGNPFGCPTTLKIIGGLLSAYNNEVTTGLAVPYMRGTTSQKSETAADANVLTVTPASTVGVYRACFTESVSAAVSATLGWTATYTDSNGNAQTPTNLSLFQTGVAAPALTFTTSAASNYYNCVNLDVNNAGVNIVIKTTFAGTSFTGKVSASVERISN